MDLTLTFGEMPTREQFDRAWDRAMSDEDNPPVDGVHFHFGNDERLGDAALTREELWAELTKASDEYQALLADDSITDPERVGDWVSRVLYCLGIEWV